jgi:TetR/AcrR family transcriptional regulator, transcriptional repressor for nem operon
MRRSKAQVDENRRAILDAAGRLYRERGFDAVTVAEVMKAAGLTHGAFYGYYASKEELIAATVADLASRERPSARWGESIGRYLTQRHRNDRIGGCPVAALGPESIRQSAETRAAMTQAVQGMIGRLAAAAPGNDEHERRADAVAACAAMVGAVILSRAVDDPRLADELLSSTREKLTTGRDG